MNKVVIKMVLQGSVVKHKLY